MVGWNGVSPDQGEEEGAHLDAWEHQIQITPFPSSLYPHQVLLPVEEDLNSSPNIFLKHQQPLCLEDLIVLKHLMLSQYFV